MTLFVLCPLFWASSRPHFVGKGFHENFDGHQKYFLKKLCWVYLSKKKIFIKNFFFSQGYMFLFSLQCRRILGGRNLVRVRSIVVAAIFDFMTVEDWGE